MNLEWIETHNAEGRTFTLDVFPKEFQSIPQGNMEWLESRWERVKDFPISKKLEVLVEMAQLIENTRRINRRDDGTES